MRNAHCLSAAVAFAAIAFSMPMAVAQTAPAACDDMKIAIYFKAYETELAPQSQRVIEEAGQQLKGCDVTGISVNVLSEEAHSDEEASLLSEARADNVMAAIFEHGIKAGGYNADFSRMEAAAPSAKTMVEPMARRVNVAFQVQPRVGV